MTVNPLDFDFGKTKFSRDSFARGIGLPSEQSTPMTSNKMPMMDVMQMMGMMRQSDAGMAGMATIDRVEGRIAFILPPMHPTSSVGQSRKAGLFSTS